MARPNAGDRPRLEQAAAEAKRQRQAFDGSLREILKSVAGRRVLWGLLERAGVYRASFMAGLPDQTAFNEGRRSEGNRLLADILRLEPELYLTMQREHLPPVEVPETAESTETEETDRG